MRLRARIGFALCVLSAASAASAGTGVPDAQQWSEIDLSGATSAHTSLTGLTQLRFSENLPNPVYTALGLDFAYQHSEWTITAGYRHQVTGHQTDDPKVTQVGLIAVQYAHRFDRGTLALRSRIENTVHATANPWRLRLRAEYRWATPGMGVLSYLYTNDEVFYQASLSEWYRNRFQAGAALRLDERTSFLIYYQRQDDRVNTPGALNVLGIVFKAEPR